MLPAFGALLTTAANQTKAGAVSIPSLEAQCSQMSCASGVNGSIANGITMVVIEVYVASKVLLMFSTLTVWCQSSGQSGTIFTVQINAPNLEQGPEILRPSHTLFKPVKSLLFSSCAYMVPKSFHRNWAISSQGDISNWLCAYVTQCRSELHLTHSRGRKP